MRACSPASVARPGSSGRLRGLSRPHRDRVGPSWRPLCRDASGPQTGNRLGAGRRSDLADGARPTDHQWSRSGGSVSGNKRRFHLGEQHRLPGPVAQAATARRGVWHQGPPVARRVADNSRHSSAWAAERYRQTRTRGARHPHAVRVVARAWIRVIWACWDTGTAYTPSRHRGEQLAAAMT